MSSKYDCDGQHCLRAARLYKIKDMLELICFCRIVSDEHILEWKGECRVFQLKNQKWFSVDSIRVFSVSQLQLLHLTDSWHPQAMFTPALKAQNVACSDWTTMLLFPSADYRKWPVVTAAFQHISVKWEMFWRSLRLFLAHRGERTETLR